jgi:hypothetical protein
MLTVWKEKVNAAVGGKAKPRGLKKEEKKGARFLRIKGKLGATQRRKHHRLKPCCGDIP